MATTNGTTFWVRDPTTGLPKMLLCNLSINIGKISREKDTSRKLEDKDAKGDRPGSKVNVDDTVVRGEYDFGSEAERCACAMIISDDSSSDSLDEQLITQAVVATCQGCAIPLTVWLNGYDSDSIEPDQKYIMELTFTTMNCWCGDKFDYNTGTAPDGFGDFEVAIAEYYESLEDGGGGVPDPDPIP